MLQRTHPSSPFIIGMVVAAFLTGESLAQEKTDWKSRFYTEAPKHWEEYLRFARTLQFTRKENEYFGTNRTPERSLRTEIKQTRGASLCVVYREIGTKRETEVEGCNPSYAFELKRRGPDKGWIITKLNASNESPTFSDEQRTIQENHLQDLCVCLRLEVLWLPMLLRDPNFNITSVKQQEIEGHKVVRFDFDYLKPEKDYPNKGVNPIKGGWMVLDPEHDWILREYLVHRGQPEKNYDHVAFQIREGTDHHPISTHMTYRLFYKKAGEKQFQIGDNSEAELEAVEQSDVPIAEFTLSAFGLQEPPGVQIEKSRLHLWIALVGMVSLGIAILIRWCLYRRRTAG